MAEHEQIAAAKKRETEQKRSRENDKEQLQQLLFNGELSTYPLADTPFYPRMDVHAASLSKIQSPVQRNEFIKQLHRTYGNRYVQRLAENMKIQAKLSISQPGDVYEQEADRVAEEVTRSINAPVRRQAPEEEEELQMQEDEEELLQGKLDIRTQTPEEDEELVQGNIEAQRQSPEEDEELMQGKLDIRRQSPEEDEELMQGKLDVQRQSPEEDEELVQGKLDIRRQSPEEDEELMQGKLDVQRQGAEEEEELIQGKFDVNRQSPEEEEELQMKPDVQAESIVADDIETRINGKKGSGQPLSNEVKEPMEQAFGSDFGGVRIHTDAEADTLNRELSAKAFTTGQDIFFRQGEYTPGSEGGQKLIAHELTHVVQQSDLKLERMQKKGLVTYHKSVNVNIGTIQAIHRLMSERKFKEKTSVKDQKRHELLNQIDDKIKAYHLAVLKSDPTSEKFSEDKKINLKRPFILQDIINLCEQILGKQADQNVREAVVELKQDAKKNIDRINKTKPSGPSGRRADLAGRLDYVIKLIFAGSGDEEWKGHEGEGELIEDSGPIRKVERSIDKFTIEYGGPKGRWSKGIRDTGKNSIDKLRKDALERVGKLKDWLEKHNVVNIAIHIRGHSRGAVAASLVAKQLAEKGFEVELVQYDPVPGPRQEREKTSIDVSSSIQSTVIYSLGSGYGCTFTPQQVLGAKHLIITPLSHDVSKEEGFIWEHERIKGNRLNSLPEGVYVDTGRGGKGVKGGDLERVPEEEYKKSYEAAYKKSKYSDWGRKEKIDRAAKAVYGRHH